MAKFRVTSPDGGIYEINAPDNATEQDVLSYAQQQFASLKPPTEQETRKAEELAAQSTNPIRALGGYAANVNQLIPFSDELVSGVGAVFGGNGDTYSQRYDDLQKQQQAMREAGKELNPQTATGQLGLGLASMKLLPSPTKLAEGAGVFSKAYNNAKTMAPLGALYGAGEQDAYSQDSERLGNAALGAAGVGTFGAALPFAAKAISGTGGLIKGGYNAIKSIVTNPTAEEVAGKYLAEVLRRSKVNVQDAPVGKNLLQYGGKGAVDSAESIFTRGGDAGERIEQYSEGRTASLPNELAAYLKEKFAPVKNLPEMLSEMKSKVYERARPAYSAAYDYAPALNDAQINQGLDRISSAGYWNPLTRDARSLAALEGETLGNIDATGLIRSFSTKDLDYMTRALRNLGKSTEGQGAMGGNTEIGAKLKSAAMSIRSRLGELNPKFGEAVKQYGDDVSIYNAAEAGQDANLFGSNWKSDVFDYNRLNDTAKQVWRLGQAEKLQNMIDRNPNAALRQFNSRQFNNAMKEFYEPEAAATLQEQMAARLKEVKDLQRVTSNSRTEGRRIQQQLDNELAGGGLNAFAADVAEHGSNAFFKRIMKSVSNALNNTPKMQQADNLVTRELLSTPFNVAAGEATGQIPPEMLAQYLRKPKAGFQPLQYIPQLGNGNIYPLLAYEGTQ